MSPPKSTTARTRVYLPLTLASLRAARAAGRFAAPLRGHAVTAEVEAALPGADIEEQEYAAMAAAALDSVRLLGSQELPLRMVAAVDVGGCAPAQSADAAPSEVTVPQDVPLRRLASVHVDSPAAERNVAVARAVLADPAATEEAADAALERCLDHDLEWYAAQEVGVLLDELGTRSSAH